MTNYNFLGVLTKTIVATKERLEGVGSQSGGEAVLEETIKPTQRRREMEAVRKEVGLSWNEMSKLDLVVYLCVNRWRS